MQEQPCIQALLEQPAMLGSMHMHLDLQQQEILASVGLSRRLGHLRLINCPRLCRGVRIVVLKMIQVQCSPLCRHADEIANMLYCNSLNCNSTFTVTVD